MFSAWVCDVRCGFVLHTGPSISKISSQDVLFRLGGACRFWTEVALCLCYWFRLDTVNRSKLLKEVEEALWKAWTKESLFLDDGKWWLQEAWNSTVSTRRL